MEQGMPEKGEIVVCKVTKILNYGVFAKLLEYGDLNGFVHVSQVSSGWVKNIRNVVKENQIRAAQAIRVDRVSGQIDMSFTKVSAGAQRAKIESWNQLKRTQRLLEVFAKDQEAKQDDVWREIAEPLIEEHGSLPEAFSKIALERENALECIGKKWRKPFLELVGKNVEVPRKTVRGTIKVGITKPNGAEAIRGALIAARDSEKKAEVGLSYKGSGAWSLKVTSHDYKEAEKAMRSIVQRAEEQMQKAGGRVSFEKLG